MSTEALETHPIQINRSANTQARCPTVLTLRAYEVYCHLHGEQPAMVTGGCRGGFELGELLGFLYARSFPKNEWRERVQEAFKGMEI